VKIIFKLFLFLDSVY